eukprot:m.15381 g.15381  ORF g.15381 m.15381 type:complete len:236 (-) comp3023_c0_seq2:195-902(-)
MSYYKSMITSATGGGSQVSNHVRIDQWDRVKTSAIPQSADKLKSQAHRKEAQRMMEQEQWEESNSFKNLIYTALDEEEADYLDTYLNKEVDNLTKERQIIAEQLAEYKKQLASLPPPETAAPIKISSFKRPEPVKKFNQASLIAGAVKRKGDKSDDAPGADDSKRTKTDAPAATNPTEHEPAATTASEKTSDAASTLPREVQEAMKVAVAAVEAQKKGAVLSSLAAYGSDDEDED